MKYFSMFTGVGGFEYGVSRGTGGQWECVGYSEINKYCNQVMRYRYPTINNYGDATKIDTAGLPDFDMLCGGFPCQSFSIAGKRAGFEDTRGTMFFEIARIIKAKRPKLALLENVKGLLNHNKGETFKVIIQALEELGYDVQWMVLNSKFFGVPQNRERVFIIASIRGSSRPEILPFREDAGEVQGILEYQTDDSRPEIGQAKRRYGSGGVSPPLNNWSPTIYDRKGFDSRTKGFRESIGSTPTLSTKMGTGGNNVPMVKGFNTMDEETSYAITNRYEGFAFSDVERKRRTMVRAFLTPDREEKRQNGRRQKDNGEEMFMLTGQDIHGVNVDSKLRRLTPVECERLQGFPDDWTKFGIDEQGNKVIISDTQRYKMMGNAVTTKVVEAIISCLDTS